MTSEWPCELLDKGSKKWVRFAFEPGGGAFVARIVDSDPVYKWARRFAQFSVLTSLPRKIVALVPFREFGALPAPLDIRWGPRGEEPVPGKCSLRGYFIAADQEPYLWTVDESAVHRLLVDKILPPMATTTKPRRSGERAPIVFDEEV